MNPARSWEKGKQGMGSPPLPKDWWDLGAAAAPGAGGERWAKVGGDGHSRQGPYEGGAGGSSRPRTRQCNGLHGQLEMTEAWRSEGQTRREQGTHRDRMGLAGTEESQWHRCGSTSRAGEAPGRTEACLEEEEDGAHCGPPPPGHMNTGRQDAPPAGRATCSGRPAAPPPSWPAAS